jgi:hypothetical protein
MDASARAAERTNMAEPILIELEIPADLKRFTLPEGVKQRLQTLLDRQDRGDTLTPAERVEAEGLVDLAELLSLLKLRARRVARADSP